MPESPEQRVAHLLAEGLELFGQDRVAEAVARWRAVLALDPANGQARDYLESAGVAAEPAAGLAHAAQGLALVGQGDPEQALALLERATREAPAELEAQAALELVRARLYTEYQARLAGGRPRPRLAADQLLDFDLPPEAGFLLSMLDGRTPVEELMALAGLDPFELLRLIARLERAGIVEISP